MWPPAHIDGRTLIILEERPDFFGSYMPIESGRLSHDGQKLTLISDHQQRRVTNDELQSLKLVTETNRIDACRGFDFFLIRASSASSSG